MPTPDYGNSSTLTTALISEKPRGAALIRFARHILAVYSQVSYSLYIVQYFSTTIHYAHFSTTLSFPSVYLYY